jgi:hypothetical protein
LKLEELGREMVVLALDAILYIESGRRSLSPRCTMALKLGRLGSTVGGGGDVATEASRLPETEEIAEGMLEDKAMLDAGVELLSESTLAFTLLAVGAFGMLEVERPFEPSVTEGGSE